MLSRIRRPAVVATVILVLSTVVAVSSAARPFKPCSSPHTRGADRLIGNRQDDCLFGGRGNDVLRGQRGWDLLEGGVGDDTLVGGRDPDYLNGHAGKDRYFGGAGDDYVRSADGDADIVRCGPGRDVLIAVDEKDAIAGDCERGGHHVTPEIGRTNSTFRFRFRAIFIDYADEASDYDYTVRVVDPPGCPPSDYEVDLDPSLTDFRDTVTITFTPPQSGWCRGKYSGRLLYIGLESYCDGFCRRPMGPFTFRVD